MSADELLAGAFFRTQPAAAARLLESMAAADAQAVIATTPAEDAAFVLQQMLPTTAARCIESLPVALIVELMRYLPSQAGAALLRHLSEDAWRNILAELGGTRAAALRLLLRYPRTAVGAWMEPNALMLPHDLSVRDARARITAAEGRGARIYLLDRERKVRGVTDGLTLLRSGDAGRIESIAERIQSLWAREPLSNARDRELWDRETELPVVNRQQEFVGVISRGDVTRGLREIVSPEIAWGNGGEMHEVADALMGGLQGAWQSLAGVFESDDFEKRGKRS